jgi:hypothetical protein
MSLGKDLLKKNLNKPCKECDYCIGLNVIKIHLGLKHHLSNDEIDSFLVKYYPKSI